MDKSRPQICPGPVTAKLGSKNSRSFKSELWTGSRCPAPCPAMSAHHKDLPKPSAKTILQEKSSGVIQRLPSPREALSLHTISRGCFAPEEVGTLEVAASTCSHRRRQLLPRFFSVLLS